jgi:antitoxin component of MazEF toxin-antitoxin module
MERKLVRQGKNALTVTLPSRWIQKFNLSQNNSVIITEEKENLIISTSCEKKEKIANLI